MASDAVAGVRWGTGGSISLVDDPAQGGSSSWRRTTPSSSTGRLPGRTLRAGVPDRRPPATPPQRHHGRRRRTRPHDAADAEGRDGAGHRSPHQAVGGHSAAAGGGQRDVIAPHHAWRHRGGAKPRRGTMPRDVGSGPGFLVGATERVGTHCRFRTSLGPTRKMLLRLYILAQIHRKDECGGVLRG